MSEGAAGQVIGSFYNPADWYWIVDGSKKVYSSARLGYVSASDDAYKAWLASDRVPSNIDTEDNLRAVVSAVGLPFDLTAYAAGKRYAVETGGISVSGIPIATDDRSKTMILGAAMAAAKDPAFTTHWVAADGTVHDVDATMVSAIADAVAAHVAASFAAYRDVVELIAAGAVATTADVDAAPWPTA